MMYLVVFIICFFLFCCYFFFFFFFNDTATTEIYTLSLHDVFRSRKACPAAACRHPVPSPRRTPRRTCRRAEPRPASRQARDATLPGVATTSPPLCRPTDPLFPRAHRTRTQAEPPRAGASATRR